MNKSELTNLLRTLKIRASRKLGQNFLVDKNLLNAIAKTINPVPGEVIVEIGPGPGNLTALLLAAHAKLIAIEHDSRFFEYLAEKFRSHPDIQLIHADATKIDFGDLTGGSAYSCVGNLPYSISSIIIAQILGMEKKPTSLCFLFQKEMAERLSAKRGTKAYNGLSVRLQAVYTVKIERRVPPNVFWPIPEVDSALITCYLKASRPDPAAYKRFSTVVKLAFSQRRKKLLTVLGRKFGKDLVTEAFNSLEIDENIRAESLSEAEFLLLAEKITP